MLRLQYNGGEVETGVNIRGHLFIKKNAPAPGLAAGKDAEAGLNVQNGNQLAAKQSSRAIAGDVATMAVNE